MEEKKQPFESTKEFLEKTIKERRKRFGEQPPIVVECQKLLQFLAKKNYYDFLLSLQKTEEPALTSWRPSHFPRIKEDIQDYRSYENVQNVLFEFHKTLFLVLNLKKMINPADESLFWDLKVANDPKKTEKNESISHSKDIGKILQGKWLAKNPSLSVVVNYFYNKAVTQPFDFINSPFTTNHFERIFNLLIKTPLANADSINNEIKKIIDNVIANSSRNKNELAKDIDAKIQTLEQTQALPAPRAAVAAEPVPQEDPSRQYLEHVIGKLRAPQQKLLTEQTSLVKDYDILMRKTSEIQTALKASGKYNGKHYDSIMKAKDYYELLFNLREYLQRNRGDFAFIDDLKFLELIGARNAKTNEDVITAINLSLASFKQLDLQINAFKAFFSELKNILEANRINALDYQMLFDLLVSPELAEKSIAERAYATEITLRLLLTEFQNHVKTHQVFVKTAVNALFDFIKNTQYKIENPEKRMPYIGKIINAIFSQEKIYEITPRYLFMTPLQALFGKILRLKEITPDMDEKISAVITGIINLAVAAPGNTDAAHFKKFVEILCDKTLVPDATVEKILALNADMLEKIPVTGLEGITPSHIDLMLLDASAPLPLTPEEEHAEWETGFKADIRKIREIVKVPEKKEEPKTPAELAAVHGLSAEAQRRERAKTVTKQIQKGPPRKAPPTPGS